MNLIARLYDVTEGAVRVGGVDVRDYDLDALRHQVAMVLQKNVLFSGTIAENLRWGDANATDEEVREAAKLACADEFVDGFPRGTTPGSSKAVPTSPAARSSACASRAPCCAGPRS